MATASKPLISKSPIDVPVKLSTSDIYCLSYKKGAVMSNMYFKGNGRTRSEAIEIGKKFCEKNGLKFLNIYDWLKDIDDLLNFKNSEDL